MGKKTFLIMSILVALSLILSACATPTPETVIKTVVVEREGETVIETVEVIKTVEVEVTPTPVPREAAPLVQGVLPREETLIVGILTGRVGSPSNFNEWVGWKSRDRGMQNLANEPLWSVDFATGEIVPGLASGDPFTTQISPRLRFLCARALRGMTAPRSPQQMWSTRSKP